MKKSFLAISVALTMLLTAGCAAAPKQTAKASANTKFPQAPVVGSVRVAEDSKEDAAIVYFTKTLDAAHLEKMYKLVNKDISGKIAIKLHTGEKNGPNIIPSAWVKQVQANIPNSKIVETNTYYGGDRYTTEQHRETLQVNGWTFCPVDIMDEFGTAMLPVKGGKHFKEMSMGKGILDYDSLVVLTHFKGHTMGGFGGSNKNIGIGCADGRIGKGLIHSGDLKADGPFTGGQWSISQEPFMERMTESSKATVDHFGKKITFVNVLRRMSIGCDCEGTSAPEPTIGDIGILASTDILAIDQASVDLVYNSEHAKKHDLINRIESRKGLHQLTHMANLNMGKKYYKLVEVK
ncbi:MAG: DUF362 domain-containing protein [Phascolarctobacterium sp.]|nr:DUF362 domain-containing protein [Phascolarctobacterium sp.]